MSHHSKQKANGKVSCVLCQRSEENKTTGALSTKENVTAHQNCLLFSSGIYCKDTPEFDDLFGFSVEDVLNEVKRGKRLLCKQCWKRGATAGCEVKRCKKTYHYPCALRHGAKTIEDEEGGKYVLYCFEHYQQLQSKQGNESVDGLTPFCPHPSMSSDSNKAGSTKRPLGDSDREEEMPSKRTSEGCKRSIIDNFSDSEIEMYAPLESDLEDSANSVQNDQLTRKNTETPIGSTSGHQQKSNDEDEINIPSDAESESLLPGLCKEPQSPPSASDECLPLTPSNAQLKVISVEADDKDQGCSPEQSPVQSPDENKPGPSVSWQSSTEPPPFPALSKSCSVTCTPSRTSTAVSPGPPEANGIVPLSSSPMPSPVIHPLNSGIDSVSFWKSCNAAGFTQAIFADFLHEMNAIFSRIRSEQATQEDYDLALKVIVGSGKLAQLVAKQQQELQRKQTELIMAAAAMNEVISALKI